MTVNSTTKPLILRRVSGIPDSSVKAYVDLLLRCNEDPFSEHTIHRVTSHPSLARRFRQSTSDWLKSHFPPAHPSWEPMLDLGPSRSSKGTLQSAFHYSGVTVLRYLQKQHERLGIDQDIRPSVSSPLLRTYFECDAGLEKLRCDPQASRTSLGSSGSGSSSSSRARRARRGQEHLYDTAHGLHDDPPFTSGPLPGHSTGNVYARTTRYPVHDFRTYPTRVPSPSPTRHTRRTRTPPPSPTRHARRTRTPSPSPRRRVRGNAPRSGRSVPTLVPEENRYPPSGYRYVFGPPLPTHPTSNLPTRSAPPAEYPTTSFYPPAHEFVSRSPPPPGTEDVPAASPRRSRQTTESAFNREARREARATVSRRTHIENVPFYSYMQALWLAADEAGTEMDDLNSEDVLGDSAKPPSTWTMVRKLGERAGRFSSRAGSEHLDVRREDREAPSLTARRIEDAAIHVLLDCVKARPDLPLNEDKLRSLESSGKIVTCMFYDDKDVQKFASACSD